MPNNYSPIAFEALPDVGVATKAFGDINGPDYIKGVIRDFFVQSGLYDRYGVALLHRHFDIEPTERLVEYNHISRPWKVDDDSVDSWTRHGGTVVPRAYLFDDEGIMRPYEFEFCPGNTPGLATPHNDTEFFEAFHALLREHGLEKFLGLRDLRGSDYEYSLEVTEGKSNMMIPRNSMEAPPEALIRAMWKFSNGETKDDVCAWVCIQDPQAGHVADHQET